MKVKKGKRRKGAQDNKNKGKILQILRFLGLHHYFYHLHFLGN